MKKAKEAPRKNMIFRLMSLDSANENLAGTCPKIRSWLGAQALWLTKSDPAWNQCFSQLPKPQGGSSPDRAWNGEGYPGPAGSPSFENL